MPKNNCKIAADEPQMFQMSLGHAYGGIVRRIGLQGEETYSLESRTPDTVDLPSSFDTDEDAMEAEGSSQSKGSNADGRITSITGSEPRNDVLTENVVTFNLETESKAESRMKSSQQTRRSPFEAPRISSRAVTHRDAGRIDTVEAFGSEELNPESVSSVSPLFHKGSNPLDASKVKTRVLTDDNNIDNSEDIEQSDSDDKHNHYDRIRPEDSAGVGTALGAPKQTRFKPKQMSAKTSPAGSKSSQEPTTVSSGTENQLSAPIYKSGGSQGEKETSNRTHEAGEAALNSGSDCRPSQRKRASRSFPVLTPAGEQKMIEQGEQ
ncbi:hypothetical protein BC830DRAFT_100542 [Chytriomyces sp. MP71]|nr:hypothetical protein BC830DRAFT_100542 [Chytriomyces sp. MP71]